MNLKGLLLCSRYSFPPNYLSLCGPEKQKDLEFYTSTGNVDKGTLEILIKFNTMYPYIKLIAMENKIKEPFDPKVVEAYWIGNKLLHNIRISNFSSHLFDNLEIKKKLKNKEAKTLLAKLPHSAFPHHSFHVLNVYRRTGYLDNYHTLQTMEACLVLWGKVKTVLEKEIIVETQPLKFINNKLVFNKAILRTIKPQSEFDKYIHKIKAGDFISYHWGKFCEVLTKRKLRNLIFYTKSAIDLANNNFYYEKKNYLYFR